MEVLTWTEDGNYDVACYYKIKKFNSTYYKIDFELRGWPKSMKIWVSASSGKKRKHLDSFEPNDYSRDGGIKALLWLKEEMLSIPAFLDGEYNIEGIPKYFCISWSDSRRRDIYSRLEAEGFKFIVDGGEKILMKKLECSSDG